ncbi:MAG TPA: hypothetical protein VJ550_14125 [Geomonas sp.]|nr:hypothetical protein [Geomonas sp.]
MRVTNGIAILLALAVGVASGCSKSQETQDASKQATASAPAPQQTQQQLALLDFGPKTITVGTDFNVQPNGQSALWAKAENVTPSTVIVLNGEQMKSNPKQDGKMITCLVPKQSYTTPGTYPIYLIDTKSGSKSNELKVVVK